MSPQEEELLKEYAEAVMQAPEHLHLTADRQPDQFWKRHVQDAIQIEKFIPPQYRAQTARVLDLGSGNGIPGLPIAILNTSWQVDLLDSDNKKCGFLDTFCKKYTINNVHVIAGRAEVFAHKNFRETYDVVLARALGKLPVTLELASAFLKVGGLLIVPHGTSWAKEMRASDKAMKDLNLNFVSQTDYDLGINSRFSLLQFEKTAHTPDKYPRAIGIPAKRPL